jgi:GT2 family glycosyltransferase
MNITHILRLIFINPGMLLRLARPRMIKKAWGVLAGNSWNLQKFIKMSDEFYFRQEQFNKNNLPEIVYHLISRYKLPVLPENTNPALPDSDEIALWIDDLKRLSQSVSRPGDGIKISIIIPVYNRIRFTVACLHSIFACAGRNDYEIIIADDNSADQTSAVFENNFFGVRYLRNAKNLGFLNNCNIAAKNATGQYIVFLNNDTVVCPGWLDELVKTFDENDSIGLAGSKLVYPSGTLQEAGGIVFEDGSSWNYGRYSNLLLPQFNYMRDVDYCSGASVAIRAQLWKKLGGFDEKFAPAYYEDTDLAFQVRAAGYRVVYQPASEVVHFEGITHGKSEDSVMKKYLAVNKEKFLEKWKSVLARCGTCNPESLPADRSVKGRILIIDALGPAADKGSVLMDACDYMKMIKKSGFHITCVQENLMIFDEYIKDLQRIGVECVYPPFTGSLKNAVARYAPEADIVMLGIGRAANLADYVKRHAPRSRIILDIEDLLKVTASGH